MVKIQSSCSITGANFSPAAFSKKSTVRLTDAAEPGAIGKVGRYRGVPTPYGEATIELSDKPEKDWSHFDRLVMTLRECIDALREAGAEEITLDCSLFHDGQCNFDFSPEQLGRLAALKVELSVSCYRDESE